ncbi:MAG: ATP-dependent Clp protease proteolytic subunit [Parcubacteria group bacterium]|nr:ATP-dependent Clp protease proteolytic subunit [Parcubacteria group bacterium]
MKRDSKPSDNENDNNENDNNEDIGGLYFNRKLRLISISGVITWSLADEFFNILTGFESLSLKKPLTIYINSEGGDTYAMLKIYDHIRNSPLFIVTIVAGQASSAGFIIFMAGDRRKALPNAVLGFHAPSIYFCGGGSEGPSEAEESALHQKHLLDAMVRIVKNNSNMTENMIREYFRILTRIDAQTALKFGLVNEIINPPKKILPKSWSKILKEPK